MTTPPIVPGPDQPYRLGDLMPAAPTAKHSSPPPRKSSVLLVGLAAAVAAVILLGVGAVVALGVFTDDRPPAAVANPAPSSTCAGYGVDALSGAVVCRSPGAEPVANQGPSYATPKPGDFRITVKILEKECFGSAGCLITYRIEPQYVGEPLDPSVTWLVTYEVRGVEDGPQINTFEVTGDEASFDAEEDAQTPSSKTKLTAKATEVLRG